MKPFMLFLNLMIIIGSVHIFATQNLSPDWIYLMGWLAGIATNMILFDVAAMLYKRFNR